MRVPNVPFVPIEVYPLCVSPEYLSPNPIHILIWDIRDMNNVIDARASQCGHKWNNGDIVDKQNKKAPRGTNNAPPPCDQHPGSTEKRREFPQPLKDSRTTTREKQMAERVERFDDPELESVRQSFVAAFGDTIRSYLLPGDSREPAPPRRALNAPFVRPACRG